MLISLVDNAASDEFVPVLDLGCGVEHIHRCKLIRTSATANESKLSFLGYGIDGFT